MREFEQTYRLSSTEFYERHRRDESLEAIPRFHRHLWASFYEDVQRMDETIIGRVSRVFVSA